MNKPEYRRLHNYLGEFEIRRDNERSYPKKFEEKKVDSILLITLTELHDSSYNKFEVYGLKQIKDKNVLFFLGKHDVLDLRHSVVNIDCLGKNILRIFPDNKPYIVIKHYSCSALKMNEKNELS